MRASPADDRPVPAVPGDASLADDLSGLADLFSPARRADPYPAYAYLREARPVWHPAEGFVVLSRHRDCAEVLRDPRFGHPEDHRGPGRAQPIATALREDPPPVRSFLGLNPPDHTRLRRQVARSFTPRRVVALVPRMREITAELLDGVRSRLADGEAVDLVDALAAPLPVRVISELLGVPESDRAELVRWSHALARALDPGFLVSADERRAQLDAREEFAQYLRAMVADRRAAPGADLVSDLVAAHDRDEPMTEEELVATCVLLLIAGHETTTSLIANGTLALLRNPEELERLRVEAGLAAGAVEELLRYDPPVQVTMRSALTDAEAGGRRIERGGFALVLIASANRDPDVHLDPDRLDVRRRPGSHLAFGHGIHFCLGAPLARLEAQVALVGLTRDLEPFELAGEPEWKEMAVLRGVGRLPVRAVRSEP